MLDQSAIVGVVVVLLLVLVKLLVPKMMDAESANQRFGICVLLFSLYTAITLLVFYHFCTFDAFSGNVLTGKDIFMRIVAAFVAVNLITVFTACLYHFSREKRKLSEEDKMKLKDM